MDSDKYRKSISIKNIEKNIYTILSNFNLPKKHIRYVVDGLIFGSLRGVDTHGVELLITYLKELEGGRSKANPVFNIDIKESSISIDADGALGIVSGNVAIEKGIELCSRKGIAVVSVGNSNHFGMASIYSVEAVRKGYICLVMSHADALIAPFNSCEALLGTNPLSIAAPAEGDDLFCFDMSSSQVSYSKVHAFKSAGKVLPEGWAIDDSGEDSAASQTVHALKPLGGYKGQGIGMMVTVLAGILSKMPLDFEMSHFYSSPFNQPRLTGHFFLIIDPEVFCGADFFRSRLQVYLDRIRSAKSRVQGEKVFAPGDIEIGIKKMRLKDGVPISPELEAMFSRIHLEAYQNGAK